MRPGLAASNGILMDSRMLCYSTDSNVAEQDSGAVLPDGTGIVGMNYIRFFAMQTCRAVLRAPFLYLSLLIFAFGVWMLSSGSIPTVGDQIGVELFVGRLLFNIALPTGFTIAYLNAFMVFSEEKEENILLTLQCSPAAMTEIFWGKVLGLAIPALLIPFVCVCLAICLLSPHLLPKLVAGDALWACLVIAGTIALQIVVVGLMLMNTSDYRVAGTVISLLSTAEFFTTRYTKITVSQTGLSGMVFPHLIMMGILGMSIVIMYRTDKRM